MSILLVWEENPEGCGFFLVEEGSAVHRLAKECNRLFIHGDLIPDGHAIFELSEMILELEEVPMPLVSENISSVYYCGMLL